jgi:hypothetical protein
VSQYPFNPSPYQPPTPNYSAWPAMLDPRRPARIAAIFQFILGAILVLPSTCAGAVMLVGRPQVSEIFRAQLANMQLPPDTTVDQLIQGMLLLTVIAVVVGLLLIVLAFFVRRGSRTAAIFSMTLAGIVALGMLITLLNGLRQLAANPSGQGIAAVLMMGVGLALAGTTIARLVVVLRSRADLGVLAAQQAQYWAMMQQQGGYGYGYPPPPPAGAAPIAPPPPGGPQNPPPPAPPV